MSKDFVSAIIPAAGRGTRMNKSINKQYITLSGMPILLRTIIAFDECKEVDEIIVVVGKNEKDIFKKQILDRYKIKTPFKVVVGGDTRQESVFNAIVKTDDRTDIIAVHDGARPLISSAEIIKTIDGARKYGACILAVPVKETVKRIDENGYVKKTVNRSSLYNIRTPQTFKADILKEAHLSAIEKGIVGTDDSFLVEQNGVNVKIVKGSYTNIKITTPEDLIYAQEFLSYRRK